MTPEMVKKLVGAGLGVVIGLMWIMIGFWRTVLLAGLAGLGWWLCGSREIPEWLVNGVNNALNWIKNAVEVIKSRIQKK